MTIYEKNLRALQSKNPNLYNKLSEITTNSRFEVFTNGSLSDANIVDLTDHQPLYEATPERETESILKSLDRYRLYPALYFYGIGNGYLHKRLFENRFLRTVYIFEPELELIYVALNLTDLSTEINSDKIMLFHTEDVTSGYLTGHIKGDDVVHFKGYTLHLHSNFYEKYQDDILRVNKEMTKLFSYQVNATGNDITDELLGLEHFIQNLPTMLKNPTLHELMQKGKITDSAVIVATGPSLAKQLPILKEIQDYVTIISVDASLPILEKEGIKPDIVTSIERIALTGKFYEKTSKEFQKDIVFALTAIVDQKLLDNIKAGQLQLSMRPTGNHYYYMGLDEWGYVGIGMSAANMAYELASKIGFENVILIGQDLAYGKDGSSHAKDHIFGEDEVKHNDQKDDYIEAYGGDGQVKTTWVWKLFLNGYENVIQMNNQLGKTVTINATEGGARIRGTKEIPFREVTEKYIQKDRKKEKIKLNSYDDAKIEALLQRSNDKIANALSLGYNMQKSATRMLKEITQIIRKYQKYDISDIHRYAKEKETKKVVDKIAKVRAKYYGGEFESFYGLLISPLLTHLEYDIAYWSIQPERSQRERIHKNWRMIVFHHEWCMRVTTALESVIKVIESKKPILEREVERYSEEEALV